MINTHTMDSFGNTNCDLATELTAFLAAEHPIISEITALLDNFVSSVPLGDAAINVAAREGWFQLLCHGTPLLCLAHPNSTSTPTKTQHVIEKLMHLLDVLRDRVDNVDLLEVFIAEIPGFEDAYYCVFERCVFIWY